MSPELWTQQPIVLKFSLAESALQNIVTYANTVYTIFHLDRESRFLELSYRFVGKNVAKKMVILSFLGYPGEFESDSQTVWTGICTVKPLSLIHI